MPTTIDLKGLYERILVGDDGIDLTKTTVDALALYSDEFTLALEASPARGGDSIETVLEALEVKTDGQRAVAALSMVLELNGTAALSSNAPSSDTASYQEVMTILESIEGMPWRQRVGLNDGLKELASALRDQDRVRHSFEDALIARVVELETGFRYNTFRDIYRETKWMPPRDGIQGTVEAELTLGCNLSAYPLAPKNSRHGYESFLMNYGIDASLVTAIRELEEDKDQLMMAALAVLGDRTDGIENISNIQIEDWNSAISRVHRNGGAAEWNKIHEIAAEVDVDLKNELTRIIEVESTTYQRVGKRIASVFDKVEGISKFPSIRTNSDLNTAVSNLDINYKANNKGFIMLVYKGSKLTIAEGYYKVNMAKSGNRSFVAAWKAFTEEKEGVFVHKKQYSTTYNITSMSDMLTFIKDDSKVRLLQVNEVLEYGSLLHGLPSERVGEVIDRYFPQIGKEFAARDLYNNRVQKRFED